MSCRCAFDLSARRKPRFKLPPGTCDAHCHVFGPAATFPYAPNRRYTPEDAPKEALAALHAPSRHRARGDRAGELSRQGQPGDARRHRVGAGRAIAASPSWTTASPMRDFEALHRGGVRGVRFNFVKHLGGAPDLAVFHRMLDRIKGLGWHVVLHLDAPDIIPLSDMIRRLPVALRHRSHGPGAGRRRRRPAAAARFARTRQTRKLLDQGVRLGAHLHAALCGGGADRARNRAGGARSRVVGHGFSRIPIPRTKPTRPTWSTWCRFLRPI